MSCLQNVVLKNVLRVTDDAVAMVTEPSKEVNALDTVMKIK